MKCMTLNHEKFHNIRQTSNYLPKQLKYNPGKQRRSILTIICLVLLLYMSD